MTQFVISIGSNSNDKSNQIAKSFDWIRSILNNVKVSDIYSTPSINGVGPDYFNAVAIGYSEMTIDEFNFIAKQYEKECGRTKENKLTENIPIDIDIVIANNEVLRPKDFAHDFFQIGYRQLEK